MKDLFLLEDCGHDATKEPTRGVCCGFNHVKASRSDVLEWLGELTRREKLELLGWERCEPERPGCLDGLVPPASQVEAGAKVFKDADHLEPFASQYARAALIAAMEGVSA